MQIQRVATIHDLTGFGRCALSVILPVLSAMGHQACPLPTALLSTHPGGFDKYVFQDLTDIMPRYIAHWLREGITFDLIYSGYCATGMQIASVSEWIRLLQQGDHPPLVVVDPVMGDGGHKYRICSEEVEHALRQLLPMADIITPNITEAALLLGIPYHEGGWHAQEVFDLARGLAELGPKHVVITSVPRPDGRYANICFSRGQNGLWQWDFQPVAAQYPGTGDLFASVMIGALLKSKDDPEALPQAMAFAGEFACHVIEQTFLNGTPMREGVAFEPWLSRLQQHAKTKAVWMQKKEEAKP